MHVSSTAYGGGLLLHLNDNKEQPPTVDDKTQIHWASPLLRWVFDRVNALGPFLLGLNLLGCPAGT